MNEIELKFARQITGKVKDVRCLTGFRGIDVSGAVHVTIYQSNTAKVMVCGQSDERISKVKTIVEGGILRVHQQDDYQGGGASKILGGGLKSIFTGGGKNLFVGGKPVNASNNLRGPVHVYISTPDIESISISGSVSVHAESICQDELSIAISGASEMVIDGKARKLSVKTNGVSKLKGECLLSEVATIDAAGTSTVESHVSDKLSVAVSGVAMVKSRGGAKVEKQSVDGLGKFEIH